MGYYCPNCQSNFPDEECMRCRQWTFAEKNGSGALIVSAKDEDGAIEELERLVKHPYAWRLEGLSSR